jgi:Protein of unknown function (DUF2934)
MNPEERRSRIAEAAYYRAERRGFAADNELEDWLEAEREFDRLLTPFPDAIPGQGAEAANKPAKPSALPGPGAVIR